MTIQEEVAREVKKVYSQIPQMPCYELAPGEHVVMLETEYIYQFSFIDNDTLNIIHYAFQKMVWNKKESIDNFKHLFPNVSLIGMKWFYVSDTSVFADKKMDDIIYHKYILEDNLYV